MLLHKVEFDCWSATGTVICFHLEILTFLSLCVNFVCMVAFMQNKFIVQSIFIITKTEMYSVPGIMLLH